MKIFGVIPSRWKSSRFPGKPLVKICGRPMIWWVYQQCLKVPELDEIIVATDDNRIVAECEMYNIPVMMTSSDHPTGSDRVGEVASSTNGDLYINIQGDEPVIDPNMIRDVISIFDDANIYFGSLRKKITDWKEINAYSTVKVVVDKNQDALYFSRNVIPSNKKDGLIANVYRHVGIYAYRRDFLLKFIKMPQTELELGEGIEPLRAMENGFRIRVKETFCPNSIGVDLPEHIKIVEEFVKESGMLNSFL